MEIIYILFVSGLLVGVSQAIECYNCADCNDEEDVAYDCAILNADSCFLSKELSSGEVSKSCGVEGFNLFSVSEGCRQEGDVIFCRCFTDLCNTRDLLPASTGSTHNSTMSQNISSSITTAMTTRAGGFYCYQCDNCGSSVGVLTDCSTISSSENCYLLMEPNGAILRTCGTPPLDGQNLPLGCTTIAGYTICKCSESECNEYSDIIPAPTTNSRTSTPIRETTATRITTATRRTTAATVRRTTPITRATQFFQITTTAMENQDDSRWFCYACVDCGSSLGELVECSLLYESRSCYYLKEPNNEVLRTCGAPSFDEFDFDVGCSEFEGYTICKCVESGCNNYGVSPGGDSLTTTALSVATASADSFYCYVCSDCGSSAGDLTDCSIFTSSRSCYLTRSSTGTVLRSCGIPLFEDTFGLPDGCGTSEGTTVCKCSESECNYYEEYLDSPSTMPISTTEVAVDGKPSFYCYLCVDCQRSVGELVQCRNTQSCTLQIQNTKVSRSCGSDEVDRQIPRGEGCVSTSDGQICKCSTLRCNVYEEITGAKAPRDHPSADNSWAIFNPTTSSAMTFQLMPILWLMLSFFLICLSL
ncbi:uncharacterized protein [Watersipora subatra]|uniref:uncharacterized protein n=1 Tax=Watersipora subatra TaxID=2589382 RepID=UPI00355C0743